MFAIPSPARGFRFPLLNVFAILRLLLHRSHVLCKSASHRLPETYTKPDSSLSEILPIHCRFLLNDTHVACLDEGATHLVELRKFKSGPKFVVVRTGNYRFTLPHFPVIVDMMHKQFGRLKQS